MTPRPRQRDDLALPHDADAERALLGSVLTDNRQLDRVRGSLSEARFYRDPDPKRLAEALRYWKVKAKVGQRKRR